MQDLKIDEVFASIQGEGIRLGTWTSFVRFSGCNLNCDFCDTPQTEEKATLMSQDKLISTLLSLDAKYVVFTGGEPTLQLTRDLVWQVNQFARTGLETNGTQYNEAIVFISHVVVSPKTPKLHSWYYDKQPLIHELRIPVTAQGAQIPDIRSLNVRHLMFSPVFTPEGCLDKQALDRALSLVHKFRFRGARLSVQMHKLIHVK